MPYKLGMFVDNTRRRADKATPERRQELTELGVRRNREEKSARAEERRLVTVAVQDQGTSQRTHHTGHGPPIDPREQAVRRALAAAQCDD